MGRSKAISSKKKLNILAENLFKSTVKGTYFKYRQNDTSMRNARNGVETENFGLLLKSLDSFKFAGNGSILGSNKIKITELFKNILNFKDFYSEFFWAKNIITKNSIQIREYLEFKTKYSSQLLLGNYTDAEKTLNEIENAFGYSIWLIKNKIAFLQISQGLENQKKFSNSLKRKLPNGSLTKFLVHWISIRNENNTTIGRYKIQIEQILSKLDPVKQIGTIEYLKYQLLEIENQTPEELIQVLRLNYSTSIIDYYESFISLLKAISLNYNNDYYDRELSIVSNLYDLINDQRLENLSLLNGKQLSIINYDFKGVEIYDDIFSDRVVDAKQKIKLQFEQGSISNASMILNIYCNTLTKFNLESEQVESFQSLHTQIISQLSKILLRGTVVSSKEYFELTKIAINFNDFEWTSVIKIVLQKEAFSCDGYTELLEGEILNSNLFNPLFLEFIDHKKFADLYERICEKAFHENACLLIQKAFKQKDKFAMDYTSLQHTNYINSLSYYNDREFDEVVNFAEKLKNNNIPFYVRKANNLIANSYINLKKIKLACNFVANTYVEDKSQYPFLPIKFLSQTVNPGTFDWRQCASNTDLSIIFDVYSKNINSLNIDKRTFNNKRFAYEDFLATQQVNKPSELKLHYDYERYGKKIFIYFLRFICIESIMDLSGNFEGGSTEILEERRQICRFLIEIDPENMSVYSNEVSEIVRRQVIASRRQEVDQSRIYVDVKRIKDWTAAQLEESFYRFTSYIKSGLNDFSKKDVKVSSKESAISTPDNEVTELLAYMINVIKSSYLSSDIGLDRFISTRIRHGELERTIRIPIQRHHLITKKEFKEGPYLSNDYWIKKLDVNDDFEESGKIDKAFKNFSEQFDDLISEIATDWLQIKSSEKPQGLFDFPILSDDIEKIGRALNLETTLESFIDLIINALDNLLIYILVNIREKLNIKGKEKAKTLLRNLSSEIFESGNVSNMELHRAINHARTDMMLQFDKVIEWFVPSGDGNSAPFTIEDAILVAEVTLQEANPNFKVIVHSIDEEKYVIHGHLPIFVDVFKNIFENVIKRSGLENPEAKIILHVEDIGNTHFKIKINVSNDLGSDVEIYEIKNTLQSIKERMDKNNYLKYVSADTNSGLFKIFKSIIDLSVVDADLKATMDFGIIENRFEMDLSLPFKMFRTEEIKEN